MKKIIAFGITLFLLFSMSIPVFADLGPADFDEWYVLCGTEGYYFEDVPDEYAPDYEQAGVDMHDYIEPGIRLWVYSFDNTANEYMLIIRDSNHKTIGRGFVDVPEADFEKYFIDEHDTIPEETGEKLPEEVECVVTADSGLVLRQGPARTFPSYQVIPSQANISYQYTFDYGGYHWGYTTYKGQSGWICIDYTEKIVPTTVPTTVPATTATTAPATETDDAQTEPDTEMAEAVGNVGFFGRTATVIVFVCLLAIILALTAVVILLLVKRKNKNPNMHL